uniref:Glycoside hydrolase family 38 central domain-containing protein n=1 Tax=Acrobeloides nanus TaxID=290746 RepID=A0A914C398_9BILA
MSVLKFVSILFFINLHICTFLANTCAWNNCPKWNNSLINIHFIPHSHTDQGFVKKSDDYYVGKISGYGNYDIGGVQYIINNVIAELLKDPSRRFSFCETGFLKQWWDNHKDAERQKLVQLVETGQLELIGGGWVQPDEAASHYVDLIDQYTLGLDNSITTTQFYDSYEPPNGFCFDVNCVYPQNDPIVDNPEIESYNLDTKLAMFMTSINEILQTQRHNHVLILMGKDYAYIGANLWYENIDKLIYHLNQKSNITAFYSTPSCYNQARTEQLNSFNYTWPEKSDDFFPLAQRAWWVPGTQDNTSYWTGFYTSKPAMKGLTRKSSALLQLTRQMSSLALLQTANQLSQITLFEKAMGISQHHDAVTNSNNFSVTVYNSYGQNLNTLIRIPLYQSNNIEISLLDRNGNPVSYQIMDVFSNTGQINNMNMASKEVVFMADVKPLGFKTYFVSVSSGNNVKNVVKEKVDLANNSISNGLIQLDFDSQGLLSTYHDLITNKTFPLKQEILYYHGYNDSFDRNGNPVSYQIMDVFSNTGQINNMNMASKEVVFMADVKPLGFNTYFVSVSSGNNVKNVVEEKVDLASNSISNGLIQLDFDSQGLLSTYHDLITNKTFPLKQEILYYHGQFNNYFKPNGNKNLYFNDWDCAQQPYIESNDYSKT